ncbi:hypothetical protein N781_10305 [Pontibacillus halophilus JSM 076056 = DSM 19796]|uniref:Sporulation protein n=1 Tax=Pontibacillus halophilus JSM 076056 = DSM 19796 TaxID=1385510 RepID=A0A0A5GQI9_9BACI|nr:hypothetical protein [Pontibacillus halophilus]KGX93435.1 hypothetical protein N781_10305 [Pontibacillus halophilus JSM 076056 = DSM 19796]
MKNIIIPVIIATFILTLSLPSKGSAYSYGDPGEEKIAEAYKELEQYVKNDEWSKAEQLMESNREDFELYFTQTLPLVDEGLEERDEEKLLGAYRTALRLNIDRRLHFAKDNFDDYSQAKLLLAKARGTFNVLEPYVLEQSDQQTVDQVYTDFDEALASLGNPGLFGVGNEESDQDTFNEKVTSINDTLSNYFTLPEGSSNDGELTEENLNLEEANEGNSAIWKWIAIGLGVIMAVLIAFNQVRKRKKD